MNRTPMIHLYCDGSFSRKLGKGAYAVIAFRGQSNEPIYKFRRTVEDPTSNKCELHGLIRALIICKKAESNNFRIYCDSKYCVNTYNNWIHKWKSKNWKKSDKKPVMNLDLIKKIDQLKRQLTGELRKEVQVVWVQSHSGNMRNDLADEAAKELVYNGAV